MSSSRCKAKNSATKSDLHQNGPSRKSDKNLSSYFKHSEVQFDMAKRGRRNATWQVVHYPNSNIFVNNQHVGFICFYAFNHGYKK